MTDRAYRLVAALAAATWLALLPLAAMAQTPSPSASANVSGADALAAKQFADEAVDALKLNEYDRAIALAGVSAHRGDDVGDPPNADRIPATQSHGAPTA